MKTLILILTLFISTILFGQSNPIIDGRFANINGNFFTVNRLSVLSSDNLAMSVLSGRYTLANTGAELDVLHGGTFDSDVDLTGTATNRLLLPASNDAVTPTLGFGTGANTGFYENADGSLVFSSNGVAKWHFQSDNIQAGISGSIYMSRDVATATLPIYSFGADANTGIGWVSADTLALIAKGISVMHLGADGILLGFPTGGYKGINTLNASAVYDDNTILTGDYVFDASYEQLSITEMESFYKKNRHLPSLTSQAELIEKGNISLGQRLNEAIVAIEHQAKYIAELERRLSELEK